MNSVSELGRELGKLLRESIESIKHGSSSNQKITSEEKERLLAKLREYMKDELEAVGKYSVLATEFKKLGLIKEAEEIENIGLDEAEHHRKLYDMYLSIRHRLWTLVK